MGRVQNITKLSVYKFILSMIMLSSLILAFLITHSYISLVYNNCFGIKV